MAEAENNLPTAHRLFKQTEPSLRITAPLRLPSRALHYLAKWPRWSVHGVSAWATLKPGSRPRRVARQLIMVVLPLVRRHPFLNRTMRRLFLIVPELEPHLSSAAVALPTPAFSEIDMGKPLSLETRSTRRALQRLRAAQKQLAAGAHAGSAARSRLAYVSPLPPLKTGIADYSAALLPVLARYYDIDVIVERVSNDLIVPLGVQAIRDPEDFARHAQQYERILYHLGNSQFHLYVLDLLEHYPGLVVLHDVFLGDFLLSAEYSMGKPVWAEELYQSHGYHVMRQRFYPHPLDRAEDLCKHYPASLFTFRHGQGVVLHSEFARQRLIEYFGDAIAQQTALIPMMGIEHDGLDRDNARRALGIPQDAFVIGTFGHIVRTKAVKKLFDAFLASSLSGKIDCHLLFIGADSDDAYCEEIRASVRAAGLAERIKITGFVDPEHYRAYLAGVDIAVQLREQTRGETSKAVNDCLAVGLPVIVNAYGAAAELPDDVVLKIAGTIDAAELARLLDHLYSHPKVRSALADKGRRYARDHLSIVSVAEQYHAVIEAFELAAPVAASLPKLRREANNLALQQASPEQLLECARTLANARSAPGKRQIFVDISILIQHDLRTGIQRVVRAQMLGLLLNPPPGYRVEPVWITYDAGAWKIRHARRYSLTLLDLPDNLLTDDPIEPAVGDIYYMPDFSADIVVEVEKAGLWSDLRRRGVQLNFLVFDILPISHPQFFPPGAAQHHAAWLKTLTRQADLLLCISQDVANAVQAWQRAHCAEIVPPPCRALHLGADPNASAPSRGLPEWAGHVLSAIGARPAFLMVGTVEPRKGYAQALAAFERLWRAGIDVNLVIVGKEGWDIAPLVRSLRNHSERDRRLFWLESISDEFLEKLYSASTCLIAASEGEGFGLPLIEAAQHKMPLLIRDIPIFREIAGDHASYFAGLQPNDLAGAVEVWLSEFRSGTHRKSDDMQWFTWAENVRRLKEILICEAAV